MIAAKGSIESLAESMTIKFIGVKTKVAKEICSIVLKKIEWCLHIRARVRIGKSGGDGTNAINRL